MNQYNVTSPEFHPYGRVITGYDLTELIKSMQKTPVPEDVIYVASVPELERLELSAQLSDGIYGQLPIQIGYCNGHNQSLNALEYHRSSELNIAVRDMILLLAKQEELSPDYTLDTASVKAFFVPAGTMIELYATTLHYAPCHTAEQGFQCAVVLPRGTNEELDHRPENRCGEERLMTAKNKWLIGHPEGGLPEGTFIGLKGENITVKNI